MTVAEDKHLPANFAQRGALEVHKINALIDNYDGNVDIATNTAAIATNATAISDETTRAEAAEVLLAPIDSPAFTTLVDVPQADTADAPDYAEGRVYYDTTLHKLRIGGAAAYETVTSV